MNAPQLLAAIEARGGAVTLKTDSGGAAKIQIAPSGLVSDLAGEIQKFKPALIELLTAPPEAERPSPAPTCKTWRDVPPQAIYRHTRRRRSLRLFASMTASELHHCALLRACLELEIEPPPDFEAMKAGEK